MFSLRFVKLTRYFSPDQTADMVDMKQGKVSQKGTIIHTSLTLTLRLPTGLYIKVHCRRYKALKIYLPDSQHVHFFNHLCSNYLFFGLWKSL